MSISVQRKSIVNMAGSNKPLPMDTALKTVNDASAHVTKSEQNLSGKVHVASESTTSRKNSAVENTAVELHATSSMNNVKSGIPTIFDDSKTISNAKSARASITTQVEVVPSTSILATTTTNKTSPPNIHLIVRHDQTSTVEEVGGVSNGPGSTTAKARKSSFQITRVKIGSTPGTIAGEQINASTGQIGNELEAMDDSDELTPNTGSESHDVSRSTADLSEDTETSADTLRSPTSETDGDAFLATAGAVLEQNVPRVAPLPVTTAPAATLTTSTTSTSNGKSSPVADIQSRFKIVKILNRVRGRWKCLDFAGPPMSAAESAGSKSESPNAAVITSIQLQRMEEAGSANTLMDVGQLIASMPSTLDSGVGMSLPSQNFYRMTADTNTSLGQIVGTSRSSSDPTFTIAVGGVVIDRSGMEANCDPNKQTLNPVIDAESIDDTNESSVEAAGSFALDNKIEQAMDLVKSHLMFAVHEEVELLKEQIKELTIKNGQLEYENTVLRASATSETLAKLQPSTAPPHTGLS